MAVLAAFCGLAASGATADEGGEYLVRIMDCAGCHTPGSLMGQPDAEQYLGGSNVGFEIPGVGIFYPPNLTSDSTGAGSWSEDEIVTAVRTGVRPDGRQLVPIMPWPHYSALTDEDAYALARFLKATKPVSNQVPGPVGPNEKPPLPYLTIKMPE